MRRLGMGASVFFFCFSRPLHLNYLSPQIPHLTVKTCATTRRMLYFMYHVFLKCTGGWCDVCSGKTSLLFQFAFNESVEYSGDVVFICNKRKLESKPPFLSQGVEPSSDVFQHIQMKYLEDDEGIKKYFAAFHLYETFPVAVIIDDFGDFFNDRHCQERYGNARGRDLAMVRALALCQDAMTHANERLQNRTPCKLLLSDTHHGDSPRLLFIYKRWISSIFTIKGDCPASFLLKNASTSGGDLGRKRAAKYSIALQYLVLEGFVE